jgi:hypothetical protein
VAPIIDDTKHELHAASDAHKVVASVAKNIAAIGFTTNFILKTSINDRQIDYKIQVQSMETLLWKHVQCARVRNYCLLAIFIANRSHFALAPPLPFLAPFVWPSRQLF